MEARLMGSWFSQQELCALLSSLAPISVRKHLSDWRERADMVNPALIIQSVCVAFERRTAGLRLARRLPFSG